MFKRSILWVCVISLVVACFAVTVSAEDQVVDGHTVLNYLDYITGYDLSYASDGWAYINFGADMFTSYKEDINGKEFDAKGNRFWNLYIKNSTSVSPAYVVSQIPGGGENDAFLALDNVADGSVFLMEAFVYVDHLNASQTDLSITLFSGIKYYDSNFNYISGFHDDENSYILDGIDDSSDYYQMVEIPVNKPANAKYAVLYSRVEIVVDRTNDVNLDTIKVGVQFSAPFLRISTSYTQLIIQAIVNAKLPEGHGTIVDIDELTDILSGASQDGHQSADELFQRGPEVIEQFLSGFSFMNAVFSSLTASQWINSILVVSLSLGLFSFIVNGSVSIGRAFDHKGGKGGGKK